MSKGRSIRRVSSSRIAYGPKKHTLNKFTGSSDETLDQFLSRTSKKIIQHRTASTKAFLKYSYPQIYYGLLIAETLYHNKETIISSIEDILEIWNDETPVSEKLLSTAGTMMEMPVEIAKKEYGQQRVVETISDKFAEGVVNELKKSRFVENINNNINLPGGEKMFEELLKDAVTEQTSNLLNSII